MRGEYDFEPVRGLPEELPAGETMLWQGAPHWRKIATQVLHIRVVALYFAVALAWYARSKLVDGQGGGAVLEDSLRLGVFALGALALMALYAWLCGRTTVYTITNRRVVIRAGLALPMALNLPLAKIESADLRTNADGSGDIALTLPASNRVAYLIVWPHAQPWRLNRARPMLRGIPDAAAVAEILARAVAALEIAAVRVLPQPERPQPDRGQAGAPAGQRPRAAALA